MDGSDGVDIHETYLELLDLAFLVILELVHVALELLDVFVSFLLVLFRGLNRITEIRDVLLRALDIGFELYAPIFVSPEDD